MKRHAVGMVFPIPDGRAEEAAKDLAADIRKMGKDLLRLHEAIERGEATKKDVEDYEMMRLQIQGMAETHFYCPVTEQTFRVGDYVTKRSRFLAGLRKEVFAQAYEKIKRVFH